jgi:hypothetical protein
MEAWAALAGAMVLNGLILRWLGGFAAAEKALSQWGAHESRKWVERRGLHSLRRD